MAKDEDNQGSHGWDAALSAPWSLWHWQLWGAHARTSGSLFFYFFPHIICLSILCLDLSPLVGGSPSYILYVRDSVDFARCISLKGRCWFIMIVTLFTNILMNLACCTLCHYLLADPTLMDHTSISVDQVLSLLELYLACLSVVSVTNKSLTWLYRHMCHL